MRIRIIHKTNEDMMDTIGDLEYFNKNDLYLNEKELGLIKITNKKGKIEYIPVSTIRKIVEEQSE